MSIFEGSVFDGERISRGLRKSAAVSETSFPSRRCPSFLITHPSSNQLVAGSCASRHASPSCIATSRSRSGQSSFPIHPPRWESRLPLFLRLLSPTLDFKTDKGICEAHTLFCCYALELNKGW